MAAVFALSHRTAQHIRRHGEAIADNRWWVGGDVQHGTGVHSAFGGCPLHVVAHAPGGGRGCIRITGGLMMLPIINTCDGGGTDVVVVCGVQSILNSTGGGGSGGGVQNILNLTVAPTAPVCNRRSSAVDR